MISTNSHLQYARALYNLGVRTQVSEQLWHELKALHELFQHKKIQKLIENFIGQPREIQEKIMDETFGNKIHDYLLHLLKILVLKGRIKLLPKIYSHYSHFYHESQGIDEIVIYTAHTLEKDQEHALVKQLEEKRKRKISARFEMKPELVGGVQIFENGYVTDYSVQHYLEQLERHLLQQKIANQINNDSRTLASGQQQSFI